MKEKPIHQDKVRWQKARNKEAWRIFEQSLHLILQNLPAGSTTTIFNLFRNTVYDESKERFGEVPQKKKTPKQKGRRETELLKLVKERWLLWQAWRKAEEAGEGRFEGFLGTAKIQACKLEMSRTSSKTQG